MPTEREKGWVVTPTVKAGPKMRLEARHSGQEREFTVESLSLTDVPDEADRQRTQVARLRRDFGFPLPAPDWEPEDEQALVLLCHADGVPVGSVRLVRRRGEADQWCPYLTPELGAALPSDPAGFLFGERLVIAPTARSLEALALVMHAAATWAAALWPVREFAAITRPDLVRLSRWMGARPLSEPMVLPGSDGLGLLIGGRLDEAATRTRDLFATGGWHLTTATAPPAQ